MSPRFADGSVPSSQLTGRKNPLRRQIWRKRCNLLTNVYAAVTLLTLGHWFSGLRIRREASMAKRAIIRLQLDLPAKQQLDKLCDHRGMTQIAILSRLVKWFGTQNEVVQASVLGLLS